jgi:hypothetical protein
MPASRIRATKRQLPSAPARPARIEGRLSAPHPGWWPRVHQAEHQDAGQGRDPRPDQEGRLEADAIGEDAAHGRAADVGGEHAAHEHRDPLGAVGGRGAVDDVELAGDEGQAVAHARERAPHQELAEAAGECRADEADRGDDGAGGEGPPPAGGVRPQGAKRHGERADEHEQRDRRPDQERRIGDPRRHVEGVLGDVDRQERACQLLGEHEQEGEQADRDQIGPALAPRAALGEGVAAVEPRQDRAHAGAGRGVAPPQGLACPATDLLLPPVELLDPLAQRVDEARGGVGRIGHRRDPVEAAGAHVVHQLPRRG